MSDTLPERIRQLVEEHFPWDPGTRPASYEEQRRHVLRWLESQTEDYRRCAIGLLARIKPLLDDLPGRAPGSTRFFWRSDAQNIQKAPDSILEKMARCWGDHGPTVDFINFGVEMADLGRFRIVANFLSDVQLIRNALETPYHMAAKSAWTPAQRALREEYLLHNNCFEDLIHVHPARRAKGERCLKGIFYPALQPHLRVEVQIMTLFSEGWDKKDHCLIYEPRRRGQNIDPEDEREVYAISEALYLLDLQFDRLKQRLKV